MPRTKEQPIPRSLVLTADQVKPTLAEAFTRWKELGEYPPDAMLCKLGGVGPQMDWGRYVNVLTGEVIDGTDESLETLTHIQVKGAIPSQRFFMILRKSS